MSDTDRTTADQHSRDDRADVDEGRRADHGPNPREAGKWLSALIALLGVWMIGQAFGLELADSQFWNDVLVGGLLIAVGGYNYMRRADERFANAAAAMVAAVAGLWLIAAPFVLGVDAGFTETANDLGFWNDIAVGLLALGLGTYSAYKARDHDRDTRRAAA